MYTNFKTIQTATNSYVVLCPAADPTAATLVYATSASADPLQPEAGPIMDPALALTDTNAPPSDAPWPIHADPT
jgi:hypothetical protein